MSEMNKNRQETGDKKVGVKGEETGIHPDAKISDKAEIKEGCSIGPGAEIGPQVMLGQNCRIGPRAQLKGSIKMGKNNLVETGTVIDAGDSVDGHLSADCETEKKPGIIIGDDNIIREYSLLGSHQHPDLYRGKDDKSIVIGDNNFLMAYTVIKSGVRIDSRVKIANASCIQAGVEIESDVFVAGMVVAAENVHIGEMAMVGGHSHLTADLPPYLLADGVPARVKTMNAVALRRNDVKRSTFREIKEIFKTIFREEEELEKGLHKICEQEWESSRAKQLINFISGRDNICPGSSEE